MSALNLSRCKAAAVCFVLLISGAAYSQQVKKPYIKDTMKRIVELHGLTTDELVQRIKTRGVDFQMTPSTEKEFRDAGADAQLIAVMRANYRASTDKPMSGGVLNGKVIDLPSPTYPAIGMAVHASGAVTVDVLVDEAGAVISAEAIAGHPLLRAAAVEAATRARFEPMRLAGRPVKVSGFIVYNFKLE